MKPYKLPDFDFYALVEDFGHTGVCLSEAALTKGPLLTIAEVIKEIEGNRTVAVIKINLAEGHNTDVSEDVARAWLDAHREELPAIVPELIEVHCAEELEAAREAFQAEGDWFEDYRKQVNGDYRASAL